MTRLGQKRHTHKYHLIDTGMGKVWACALPDCYHYMPLHMRQILPGKNSICWKCEDLFILSVSNMKLAKPICSDCSKNK